MTTRIKTYSRILNTSISCQCGCMRDSEEYINGVPVVNLKHYESYLSQQDKSEDKLLSEPTNAVDSSRMSSAENSLDVHTIEQNRHLDGNFDILEDLGR